MMTNTTRAEIKRFISVWFLAIDVHVPVAECYHLLAENGLQMAFPNG